MSIALMSLPSSPPTLDPLLLSYFPYAFHKYRDEGYN